jgi:hypothetical protein
MKLILSLSALSAVAFGHPFSGWQQLKSPMKRFMLLRSLEEFNSNRGGRIVGGQVATYGQFPWQALVTMDKSYICGGSLISSK